MISFFSKYKRFFGVLIAVSAVTIFLFYRALKPTPTLPIYQPAMIDPLLVDESIQYVKKHHNIADFSLLNQNGQTITHNDYDNHIYVADFFFTTCPSICPIMTDNMRQLQTIFEKDSQIRLLSFSVTPQIDSVAQLKKYALEKGINDAQWNLLTGDKKEIYALARSSYLVAKEDGDGGPYDMIHTENFVLVDPLQRIRGFYDGTDSEAMAQLQTDVLILQQEFPASKN